MFVDGSDERIDITAVVPKPEKLAFFFRRHCGQIRIDVEKFTEGGTKFLGVQLCKIDERQIPLTEGEPPDNRARVWILQLGGQHDRAENMLPLCPGTPQRLAPCNLSEFGPTGQPNKAFL